MMSLAGVTLIALAVVAAGPTTQPAPLRPNTKIVFIGDSNTRGTPHASRGEPELPGDPNPVADVWQDSLYDGAGAGAKSAYVNLLRQRLGRGFELLNRGRGGTTAAQWANDLAGILTEVAGLTPEVVVLNVGLSGVVLKEPQNQFEEAMPKLLAAARSWPSVKKIFVVTLPPVNADAGADMAKTIKSYNDWLRNWVKKQPNLTLVDTYKVLADEKGFIRRRCIDHPDLYHLNYNGHYELAQCLFDALLETGVLGGRR